MKNLLLNHIYGKAAPLAIAIVYGCAADAIAETKTNIPQEIAQNVEFDNIFLNLENKSTVDLSRFANGASALPGTYRTLVYVNGDATMSADVEIRSRRNKTTYPCIGRNLIKLIPFNYEQLPNNFLSDLDHNDACLDLEKKLPEAHVLFDSNEQRMDISIPQMYVLRNARGSVNPELWDSGIPALILNYNVNAYSNRSYGNTYNTAYAGINAGVNIGAWYLRHNGSYRWNNDGEKEYTSINTYLQRDVPYLKGRMLMGESNTQGQVFDTLPFKGFQLASDERMLPESQRGYAPDIRGIARTNARITVRQSNQVIYETTVPPGEFLINDLYPTGYGGDLDVIVHEADGTEQTFKVAYAAVPQQLRPGSLRYSLTLANYNNDSLSNQPALYQGTLQYGLTNSLTTYGGLQASQNYYALQGGMAFGTPFGSLALDATQARAILNTAHMTGDEYRSAERMSGQSYGVTYSKDISETQSSVSLAAYRFSTSGYVDYQNAMYIRDAWQRGEAYDTIWRPKNRFILTVNQGLFEGWGQIYTNASVQNYWNKGGSDKQFQLGYSNIYKQVSYGLNVSRTYSVNGVEAQTSYMLTVSLPLGRSYERHTPSLNVNLTHDDGRDAQQVGISGNAGEYSQFGYNITAANANQGQGTSASTNVQYRSQMAALNAGYSTGKHYNSVSGGLSGTIIGHSGGITLSPYTSDTFALVEAKGAQGAAVSNYPGVFIDHFGYAAVPYLNAYQFNDINIDPKNTNVNVELDNTSQRVAPYSGAVVKLKYTTRQGLPILITAHYMGNGVPFGASVMDVDGNNVGSVGQGGLIYARVNKEQGRLIVKWGSGASEQCEVGYRLMPTVKGQKNTIQRFDTECYSNVKAKHQQSILLTSQINTDRLPWVTEIYHAE